MSTGKIIYLGGFRFPNKDAAAARVLNIGKILKANNRTVFFAGGESGDPNETKHFGEFEYCSMNEFSLSPKTLLKKVLSYFTYGDNTIHWLKKQNVSKNDLLIAYNPSGLFLCKLLIFCKKRECKLSLDITEWYDNTHLPGGRFGLYALDNTIKMKFLYRLVKNKIVISKFLFNYYQKCENRILIPPTVDLNESKWQIKEDDLEDKIIKLIYTGNAGKKDTLRPLLGALDKLNANGTIYSLTLIGTVGSVINSYRNREWLHIKNRVEQNEVPKEITKHHFLIFSRDEKKYSYAGFPTKFVESFSAQTPVITNLTSDLSYYLIDGETGFTLNSNKEDDIFNKLSNILFNRFSYEQMKQNCYNIARENFDNANYIDIAGKFLAKIT